MNASGLGASLDPLRSKLAAVAVGPLSLLLGDLDSLRSQQVAPGAIASQPYPVQCGYQRLIGAARYYYII